MENYIGIDIGTTNCKVGICDGQYKLIKLYTMPTPKKAGSQAEAYDAKQLKRCLIEILEKAVSEYDIRMIAISSMAEAGAFVEMETERLVSDVIPWQDRGSEAFVTEEDRQADRQRFLHTGLHVAYKYSVYKVLAFQGQRGAVENLKFLPAASLIAWFLTKKAVADVTLAARTYACNIYEGAYDEDFLKGKGLPADIFPEITGGYAGEWKKYNIPVWVGGHDHICASVAAGISQGNRQVFLSLGTTGAMVGCIPARALTDEDYGSGYAFGRHPDKGQMTWMGAIQSAGASIDWAMGLGGVQKKGYSIFEGKGFSAPTGILYYPYLNGSGPPNFCSEAGGAFLGLSQRDSYKEWIGAVLEGIAYEIRFMLEHCGKSYPEVIKAVGGCTKNTCLMQTISNVTGCGVEVPDCGQSALCGAVMAGNGIYCGKPKALCRFEPEKRYKAQYEGIYGEYLKFRPAILNYRRT